MNRKKRLATIAGSVLIVVGVLAGAAFAASQSTDPAPSTSAPARAKRFDLDAAVAAGKLTAAEADVLKKIGELRKAAMEKLRGDAKAIIDQAVNDGKITREQADKLLKKGAGGFGHGRFGPGGIGFRRLTKDELKARLDAKVKSGKLTQEQADQILNGKGWPGFGRPGFRTDRHSEQPESN